ncbi:recombinase family protein [Amycolatopsis sp. La24]|uniref:recombinase family protein n=1 Tax=Amycolatopsis sp. La24 TaxID=3028304 RepID=UPI0023AF6BD2|nr:recombinase family protein [Amycolatopsis sp. La24]
MNIEDDPVVNPPAPAIEHRTAGNIPVSGPSGLSDYAVSPLGTSTAALMRDEVRVAVLGRTSTEDQQDPRQSLIRQVGNCRTALPESWVIVAHFYDVESGRMELDQRGRGENYERFDIPIARDGGIADLLAEAAHPGRRFDVVICESIARVARRAYEGLSVERELEHADVPLFASNEPITLSGSRAQRVLQRRINQSIAEYEVLNTLEQSWGGLCTHVREGFNIGKPPYGYKAKIIPHPNPSKAAKGHTKSRLERDDIRAETVTQIANWRYHEQLGYGEIADRLNADLESYPPPEPPGGRRARKAWGKTSVYEVLRNPKYTGYQVFNRRARRSKQGKVNDPVKWVWSLKPTHEPLIPKWMYDELNARRRARRGSRGDNDLNVHPQTLRTYVLRGMVFCGCGRRMAGTVRHEMAYYTCWPKANNRGRPDTYSDHPKAVYLRESAILDAVSRFVAERVFGPRRREILAEDLGGLDDRVAQRRRADRERLQRILTDLDRRQASILRQAQDGDPADPFTQGLRGSYNELETKKKEAVALIAELDAADETDPGKPGEESIALLDALPVLALNLAYAPEDQLRRLFEILQLGVRLVEDTDEVTIQIKLPADDLPEIAIQADRTARTMSPKNVMPVQRTGGAREDAVRASSGAPFSPRPGVRRLVGKGMDHPVGAFGCRAGLLLIGLGAAAAVCFRRQMAAGLYAEAGVFDGGEGQECAVGVGVHDGVVAGLVGGDFGSGVEAVACGDLAD